jgi:DNA repair ATPase RecN
MDEMATSQGAEFSNRAIQAAKEMGGVTATLQKVNDGMQELVNRLNDDTSKNFMDAAAKSAESFSNAGADFLRSTKAFDESVTKFSAIPAHMTEALSKFANSLIEEIKSRSGGIRSTANEYFKKFGEALQYKNGPDY